MNANIAKIRSFHSDAVGGLVVVSTGGKEKTLGFVVPLGQAFQVQDADGKPVALKSLESQAVAWFKYNR